jgi:hypothetical protein
MINFEKLVLVGLLLSAVAAWSQSSVPRSYNADSNSINHSLLARSEMQQPQPLPIVRPLRLQEIPTAEREKVRPGSITPYVSKEADKPAIDIKLVGDQPATSRNVGGLERDEGAYGTSQ